MISKCHCKLLWDDDVDVGEYEEFFDFTKNDKDDEDDAPLEYDICYLLFINLL